MDKLTIISGCLFLAADIFAIASIANPDWINTGESAGALTVGLVRQCQTIHGRERTCIPPSLPPEWVITLLFIIMGIVSLTLTCGLLLASPWHRQATKYARWIAFTGMILFCMAALIFPIGFYISEVGGQPYKLPNNTVVGSSYVLFVLSIFFTIVGLLFAGKPQELRVPPTCLRRTSPKVPSHRARLPAVGRCLPRAPMAGEGTQGDGAGARRKSAAEWLEDHSVGSSGLSLSHVLSHGTSTLTTDSDGVPRRHLEIRAGTLNHFEARLLRTIDLYHARIKWLTEGSLKVFGLVKGSRVGLVVDVSDAACESGSLPQLQRNLQGLISEQLSCRKQLFAASLGSEVNVLWDGPIDTNPPAGQTPRGVRPTPRGVQEVSQWVEQLSPGGGCNLLGGLRRALLCRELDSLLLILGSCPDQTTDALFDYVEQCILGRELSVLTVAYGSSGHMTIGVAKRLAEVTRGRFHVFSNSRQGVVYSSDLELMWAELKAARTVLTDIQDMREGRVRDTLVSVVQETSAELECSSLSRLLPKAANQEAPLCFQSPGFLPSTSAQWLQRHGLKGQRLGVYQVLACHAHSPLQAFVPILRKTVSSTVHQKAMVQFEWHDGTVKNVHVDPPLLHTYQKQLAHAVQVMEKRVAWLSTGSRQIWGTVCEQRVVVLVDLSLWNAQYLPHIQLSLRLLLQEQLANRHSFNIITFGGDVRAWQGKMVETSPQNLQQAWRWVQDVQCEGGRNTLAALSGGVCVRALWGRGLAAARVTVCGGGATELPLPPPPRYASCSDTASALRSLAHHGGGRFHCFRETGIVESDDITALLAEMEKAALYWQKCSVLLGSVVRRADRREDRREGSEARRWRSGSLPLPWSRGDRPAPPPSHSPGCRSSRSRLFSVLTPRWWNDLPHSVKEQREEESSPVRALTWRPSSAKSIRTPARSGSCRLTGSGGRHRKSTVSHSVFYTEEGNNLDPAPWTQGCICSTKQWLRRFSVRKLKLDLDRLASGPDCTHHKRAPLTARHAPHSPTPHSSSPAYCNIFPSVHINGSLRHLQMTARELDRYLSQSGRLLARYARRMRWLLSGSRRVFGAVLERDVCVLLDCSGSMAHALPELKKELCSLIWDQLHRSRVRFTLLAFSGEVRAWRPTLVEATEGACREAEQWVWHLCAHGGTCTLQALQVSGVARLIQGQLPQLFYNPSHYETDPESIISLEQLVQFARGLGDSLGCYLLSDGKPDSSCSLVLQEAERMSREKRLTVHSISYNCRDSLCQFFRTALGFMKLSGEAALKQHRVSLGGRALSKLLLLFAGGLGDSLGCYLLSDGKPDSSCSLVLQEAERMSREKRLTVHSISYNCRDSAANEFLRNLAHQTGGRFHRCQGDTDALVAMRVSMAMSQSLVVDRLKHFRIA
ncbi:hypothetical protein AAFF_G00212260 [Aldrovandia affinis]|uniref:VWFA domain-containing protein n=1 Tax=Aldrovandia affinis TaxID=143900 RepID=A0AAD7W500_9TELE|nr:hypothetical protein AAFF_G00212260 [Aldrovandia affinis]